MFPELRYIWKVLENPTGRRLGQKNSFSYAIQEAQHKMLALQDSPALEPYTQGWRTIADRVALLRTKPVENIGVLYYPCAIQRTCVDPVSQGPPEKQDSLFKRI